MPKFPIESVVLVSPAIARTLAERWFPDGAEVRPLPTAGFSGSPIFLVRPVADRLHVLKAFGAGTPWGRASWVHQVGQQLRHHGASETIPAVRATVAGGTLVVADDGQLWEMAAYVEGTPIVVPAPSQIAAAMRTLATVHAAGAAIREQRPSVSASAGLAERIARAENLSVRPWRDYLRGASWSESTRFLAGRLLEASDCFESCRGVRVLSALSAAAPASLLCQVVLRDVWRDHVLFEPTELQKVVGIIDLHAAGIDTPATDVARLLGSWMPPDQPVGSSWWAEAIDAYETVRPLGRVERRLVPLLAATGIIFGIDNWFRWILIDRRHFSDQDRVAARIDRLLGILPAALKILAEAA